MIIWSLEKKMKLQQIKCENNNRSAIEYILNKYLENMQNNENRLAKT